MTVGELFRTLDKAAVMRALASAYAGLDIPAHESAWDIIVALDPKPTTLSCVLHFGDGRVAVSGREPDDPQNYAIEFVDWREWLAMPLIFDRVDLTTEQALAHILYEMTFCGYTYEEVSEEKDKLLDALDEVKATHDDQGDQN